MTRTGPARGRGEQRNRKDGDKGLRPTTSKVRNAIFSMLGPAGVSGLRALDLYAGTGALGLDALGRGAEWVDFVERDPRRCEAIRAEVMRKGHDGAASVHRGDAVAVIPRLEGRYDVVFIDPPYAVNPFERVLEALTSNERMAEGCILFLEHSSATTLPELLPGARQSTRKVYGDTAVSVYRYTGDQSENQVW